MQSTKKTTSTSSSPMRFLNPVFSVGSIGVDHTGPNYADREFLVESIDIDSDRVTVQYCDDGSKKPFSLKAKQELNNRIMGERARREKIEAAKRPSFMSIDKLEYDSQGKEYVFNDTQSDDTTSDCAHPHLRRFAFTDNLAISMCPDCSVPFTSRTESLTTIDKLRGWILQGSLPR